MRRELDLEPGLVWAHEDESLADALIDAESETLRARGSWPTYNSAHEALGILLEEFFELQREVFLNPAKRDLNAMRREAIQVAAVAIRFAAEVCSESRGRR